MVGDNHSDRIDFLGFIPLIIIDGAGGAGLDSLTDAAGEVSEKAQLVMDDLRVSVDVDGDLVRVVVTGRAPGILRGTTSPVSIVEAVPLEEASP